MTHDAFTHIRFAHMIPYTGCTDIIIKAYLPVVQHVHHTTARHILPPFEKGCPHTCTILVKYQIFTANYTY